MLPNLSRDLSVNFKDFAAETRFLAAICSGICATLIGSLSFNSVKGTDEYWTSP